MLVLLHGPEEQCLSTARAFPPFSDVLLLLLVLDQMLAFVLDEQHAPVVKLGEEIGVEGAGGQCEKSGSCRAGSASFCRVRMLSVSASCHVACSVSMIGSLIISSLFNTDAETWCRTLLSSAGVAVNSTTQLALIRCSTS